LDKYINIFSALLTPIIAIVTVCILFLQYRLSKQRWKLDLFDKRYPVFISTMSFLSTIVGAASISSEEILRFNRESKDRDMLFGEDIQNQLDLIISKTRELRVVNVRIEKNQDRQANDNRASELLEWFEQQTITKNLFSDYIKIDEK